MSTTIRRRPVRPRAGRPGGMALLLLGTFAFLWLVPLAVNGQQLTTQSVYGAFQDPLSSWGLVSLALMLTMVVGEIDLSAAGSFALGGVVAVKLGQTEPLVGVVAAVGTGAVASGVQGYVIARWALSSVAATLGGLFVLIGIAVTITKGRTVPYNNIDFAINLDKPFLGVLSWHSTITIVLFLAFGVVMRFTRLGRDIRATGGYRRGARVAGVGVRRIVCGTYVTAGALAALGGALSSYSLAGSMPNPGFAPLIFGVTAAVLGGFSLAGGTGNAMSGLAAVLALSLLEATFRILASPGWVESVVTGCVLVVVATSSSPQFRDGLLTIRTAVQEESRRGPARKVPLG